MSLTNHGIFSDMNRSSNFSLAFLSVIALAAVAFLGKSHETLLRGIDSNIHAGVSMAVTSVGPVPLLPMARRPYTQSGPTRVALGDGVGQVFNDHPFFLFWLNGGIMRALGPSAWSARLLTAAFSVGSVLLTFAIGNFTVSALYGILSALFLIFCRDFILTSSTMSLDTALVFFTLLSFVAWIRGGWMALGLAAGFGLWMKTPLVLLVFPTALVTHAAQRNLKAHLPRLLKAGALAVLVGSLLWLYTAKMAGWDVVRDYWIRQVWGTAVEGRDAGQSPTDWGFFWKFVVTGFLPGFPFLVWALIKITRRREWTVLPTLPAAAAVFILATLVTAMRYRLGHYVTPAFPFLGLLSAYAVHDWLKPHEDKFYLCLTAFTVVLVTTLVIAPVSLAPESFVALKRFTPFIQTQGSCDDLVLLVPGGEPVGSAHDYQLFLNFYTSRPIQVASCDELNSKSAGARWIILSHQNRQSCLSLKNRKRFSQNYRVGNQYLLGLGHADPSQPDLFDLTPLELEQQAVTDCQAPHYPRDRYHSYVR